ncbi:TolC family protein [Granulicella sp. L60]|uniref:TolC family protein n=1 Tax=Granulicella sp. L60 TaxID=1641866 RepID=UPI00131CC191|nr:TolC family protein [Granulicella sp. L60]
MKRMLFAYRPWLLMTVVLAGSVLLSAQSVPPPDITSHSASDFIDIKQGVTEAELVTRALASNPMELAQRQQIAMTEGDITQANLRKNPSLTLGGLKEVNGGDNSFNAGGMLPLELYGRRARRTEVAQSKEGATQQSVADQERLLAGEVRTRFGEALASIRNLMFTEQLLQVNWDFLKLMEDRVREGATPPLDANETRVEVNRIEAMRIDYQAKAEVALLALKEAVGIDPEEFIRLRGALELAPLAYDQKQLLQLAVEHRPDLAFQRANEALANAELRLDKATARPDASVFGGYQRPDVGFSQQGFDAAGNLAPIRQTFNYAIFGLNIDLPLFNRNQGAIVADTAAIQATRSQVAAVNLTLRHEVAQNLVRFSGAQARVALYRAGVRDQANHNLDVVRQTYSYGRTTLLDVIAEQRRYIDIETGYTDILLDAYTARIALEQAVGTNLP